MKILEWEDIDEYHRRARIFNGWLVKVIEDVHVSLHEDMRPQSGYEWRVAMCFVPDPYHSWELDEEEVAETVKPLEVKCDCIGTPTTFNDTTKTYWCDICGEDSGMPF